MVKPRILRKILPNHDEKVHFGAGFCIFDLTNMNNRQFESEQIRHNYIDGGHSRSLQT